MGKKVQLIICSLALLSMAGSEVVEARSTFTARFASGAIAGPNIEQTAVLYLHYFPGDGEALIRTEIDYERAVVSVGSARSSLGKVRSVEPVVEIDYSERPLGREGIDTLYIALKTGAVDLDTRWEGKIFSSLDTASEVAHTSVFGLEVGQPIQLKVSVRPPQVYPGEQVDLELVVHNIDPQQRSINKLTWEWPEGLSVLEGKSAVGWVEPLAPGQQDTLQWQIHVEREEPGDLVIGGWVEAEQISGSPVPEIRLRVAAMPVCGVKMNADFLEVGKKERLVYTWSNPGTKDIEIAELRLDIPEGFADLKLLEKVEGISIEVPGNDQKGQILLKDTGTLAPGQNLELEIEVRPLKPGPFPWKSSFKPTGHFWHIPLGGRTVVAVVQARNDQRPGVDELNYPTDLQLLGGAFDKALERELEGLVLRRGLQIYLQPDGKGEENWVVEDVLTRTLMEQGYQISLKVPSAEEVETGVMYYRMVDSRIVYTPQKKGWNRFSSQRLREAYGDLFLRLEVGGKVEWARRVPAYKKDEVPADKIGLLGGSDMVERTVIESDYKLVERGLSGSIIGGLLYIFFVP